MTIGVTCREPTSKCWPGPTFVEQWRSQAGFLAKALPRSGGALPKDLGDLGSVWLDLTNPYVWAICLGMIDLHNLRHTYIQRNWTEIKQTTISKSGSVPAVRAPGWPPSKDWGIQPRHVAIMQGDKFWSIVQFHYCIRTMVKAVKTLPLNW